MSSVCDQGRLGLRMKVKPVMGNCSSWIARMVYCRQHHFSIAAFQLRRVKASCCLVRTEFG